MMCMVSIAQWWNTSLHAFGIGRVSAMCGWVLPEICTSISMFCCTSHSFVSGDKLGISPMGLGLMCLSLCGLNKMLQKMMRKMMTVFVVNYMLTVINMFRSVAYVI